MIPVMIEELQHILLRRAAVQGPGGAEIDEAAKIYGGNKMRVYQQVWEGAPEGQWDKEYAERVRLRKEFMERYGTR